MTASQAHISPSTPMGARRLDDGVTLRVWAPHADHVYLAQGGGAAETNPDRELLKDPNAGHWTGFFADLGPATAIASTSRALTGRRSSGAPAQENSILPVRRSATASSPIRSHIRGTTAASAPQHSAIWWCISCMLGASTHVTAPAPIGVLAG
jgi:hypothetical protein